jgi:sugar/nucleoside kinase (ribokinase family)
MLHRHFVLCIGPLLIDRLLLEAGGAEHLYPGGNAVIFSSVTARMGVPTAVIGQLGADAHGDTIRRHLESHCVDTGHLVRSPHHRTKVASVGVDLQGSWHKKSSDPELFPYLPEIPSLPDFHDCMHLHVGGLNGLLRAAPAATLSVIEACRRAGLSISIGLAPGVCDRSFLDRAIRSDDLLLGTAAELSFLLDRTLNRPEEIAEALVASDFESFVITLGPLGALARWRGSAPLHVPTQPHAAVSTVGAGDVFAGVLVSALLSSHAIEVALRLAACAASLSVTDLTWDRCLEGCDLSVLHDYVEGNRFIVAEV